MSDVALYGKLPSRGDFVRVGCTARVAIELDQLFQGGVQELHRARLPHAVRASFVFAPAGAAEVAVGALAPSRDKAGREYPVASFAWLPAADAAAAFPALPSAWEGFLERAQGALQQLGELDYEQAVARVGQLAPPPDTEGAELERARGQLQASLAQRAAGEAAAALFEDAGQAAYGFHTFCTALRAVAGRPPSKGAPVLDCPARDLRDVALWLELARVCLGAPRWAPSCFWQLDAGRLLLATGQVPPQIFPWLADVEQGGGKLWRLRTEMSAAVEQARGALGATAGMLEAGSGATVAELLSALAAPTG